MDLTLLDAVMRWVLLVLFFLLLTYLFRDKIVLEGPVGYILILFALIPINLLLRDYVAFSFDLPFEATTLLFSLSLIGLNLFILFVINRMLPGLTVSSFLNLFLFSLLFSIASLMVHHVPALPYVPALFD
ncbi:hypothetical protein HQ520_07335 [bacterium]|nr:hypothetical protein [bacterium]